MYTPFLVGICPGACGRSGRTSRPFTVHTIWFNAGGIVEDDLQLAGIVGQLADLEPCLVGAYLDGILHEDEGLAVEGVVGLGVGAGGDGGGVKCALELIAAVTSS